MARDMCRKTNLGWTVDPDFDPEFGIKYLFCFLFFVFVFLLSLYPGCIRVVFFIFVTVLWSSCSVGALPWRGMVGSLQFGVVPALCYGGFVL